MTLAALPSQLLKDFTVSTQQLENLIELFLYDMREGLAQRHSSLAMLPSYLSKPSGQEKGIFLALDFGGTNVRALKINLQGNGKYQVLERQDAPLVSADDGYNYIASTATAEQLFDFLAAKLAALATESNQYVLGHAFSFPCRMSNIEHAELLYWTKELATSGVVGNNIVELLNKAFVRQGIRNIKAAAILNDSISALLAAAYKDTRTDIGSICGTGHNTCYLEPSYMQTAYAKPMYMNMESGNFDKVPQNRYDKVLDKNSDRPGAGRLEKMCSGRYIGELFRLACYDLIDNGVLPQSLSTISLPSAAVTGKDMAGLSADSSHNLQAINAWLSQLGWTKSSQEERMYLQNLATLIVQRSARLVAATYAATLRHIDPEFSKQHVIAIDGSLYEKMPGYASKITETLYELLGKNADKIQCKLSKDGSGVGAAVAAATTLS